MKRFERSNGLDTASYKNYIYLFTYLVTEISLCVTIREATEPQQSLPIIMTIMHHNNNNNILIYKAQLHKSAQSAVQLLRNAYKTYTT